MTEFIQQAINGLTLGMGYAVAGIGLTIIFGLLRVMNFAHGEFFTLGAFALIWVLSLVGLSYFAAAPFALLLAAIFAGLVYLGLIKPSERQDTDGTASLMVTYGLSLVMLNGTQLIAGPEPRAITTGLIEPIRVADIIIPAQQALVVGVGVAVFIWLAWLLRATNFGRRLRAVAQNETGAALMAIPVERVKLSGFVIGSALVGLAGIVVGPAGLVTPSSGQNILFVSFIVVILGGLGSVPGAAVAGLLLGLIEGLGGAYLSSQWTHAYGFVLLLLVLALRPEGIAGQREKPKRRRRFAVGKRMVRAR